MIINTRLNHCFHRILNCSPYELVNNFSIFDPIRRKTNLLDNAISRTRKNIEKNEEKSNLTRKEYKFNLGELVYTKSKKNGKLESLYCGPFEVIGIMENRLLIKMKEKSEWINLKRIKKFPTL